MIDPVPPPAPPDAPGPVPPALAKKLAAILADLERLPKRGYNAHHQYAYVTESDVADAIRPLLAQHGVACLSTVESLTQQESTTTVWVRFTLVDAETGAAWSARYPGQGQDRGDKGIPKALTAATKYFLLKTFVLSAGDDPEAEDADAAPPARADTPPRPAAARPALPSTPFAAQVLQGACEPKAVQGGQETVLLFRGQAVAVESGERFALSAWRDAAQLLDQALRERRPVVITGAWSDRFPEFQVRAAQWPTAPAAPADPPAAADAPPRPAPVTELQLRQLSAAMKGRHWDVAHLMAWINQALGTAYQNPRELSETEASQVLARLHAEASAAG